MTTIGARTVEAARMLGEGLVDLLLPPVCPACGEAEISSAGLCNACNVELLSLIALPYCPHCATTLGPNIPAREDGCSQCPTPLPRFFRAVRLGPYAGPLRSAVRDLKYHRRNVMLAVTGRLLARAVGGKCAGERFDAIVPVPSHWRRRMSRGTDHATAMARAIAKQLSAPVDRELVRVRHTPPQTHLSRTRRLANVRNAFAVRDSRAVAGANILLVDDVTTTGATANEAARTLLKADASRVTLAVIAKSEPPTAYAEHFINAR